MYFTDTEITIITLALTWQLVVPVTYIFTLKQNRRLGDSLVFIIGSITLSLLIGMFLYMIFAKSGIVTLLASITPLAANGLILLIAVTSPLLIASGYYYLERYNREN